MLYLERQRALKRFGITPEQYEGLLAVQGGVCAICDEPDRSIDKPRLAVDHDHETKDVRGLLCVSCNRGLGFFRDNPDILVKAVEYLRQPSAHRDPTWR
jgi:hypothetical protein